MPGPLMTLNAEIRILMRTDSRAKTTHDKLVSLGRQKKTKRRATATFGLFLPRPLTGCCRNGFYILCVA